MSSAAAKKKSGAKDRGGAEGAASVASVQSAFTSAARTTIWHADTFTSTASVTAATAGATGGPPPSPLSDAPRAFTAAANVACGRPFGATQLEDLWSQAEAVPSVQGKDKLLPNSRTWASERDVFTRLFPSAATLPAAFADSTDEEGKVDGLAGLTDTQYADWLAHIAVHHSSPLLYPHHTLHFDAASMLPTPMTAASPSLHVALVLHRLLATYVERCSEQAVREEAGKSDAGVPPRVFASMLYTSVYNQNFSSPPVEQKDVSFPPINQAAPQSPQAPSLPSHRPRRYDALSVISCLGVTHICVCVGRYYYKLSVIDERRGRLRSAAAIARGLEAICRHADEATQRDPVPGASPVVRLDHHAMDALFANLSALRDSDAFDVRRRLRESSAVNACSLDALQEALCVLVLRDAGATDATAPTARWLHSVCSFDVSLHAPLKWTMRLLAPVVPCQAGLEWISRAARPSPALCADQRSLMETAAAALGDEKGGDEAGGQSTGTHPLTAAALSTSFDEEGVTEHLELWLPEKHRVPLRPYPAPVWDPETTESALSGTVGLDKGSLEGYVLLLLRAMVSVKRSRAVSPSARDSEGCWPRVVLAVQPRSGGAPSLIALDSPAIQHYYEVLVARPTLFARETERRMLAQAAEEVRAVLNIIWHSSTTVQSQPPGATTAAATSWFDALRGNPVDLCISFAVQPRSTMSSLVLRSPAQTSTTVRRVVSNLGLSSALLVNCTAQQTAAETHLRASAARVVDAVVQTSAPALSGLATAFLDAMASCAAQP